MVIRKLNFTDRKRITRKHISIRIYKEGAHWMVAFLLDLKEFSFPMGSQVCIDVFSRGFTARFNLGTIENAVGELPYELGDAYDANQVTYFVVVVLREDGNSEFLGISQKIYPIAIGEESGAESFVGVHSSDDLGEEIWSLDLNNLSGRPVIYVNSDISNDPQGWLRDPRNAGLILPAVFESLCRHTFSEGEEIQEDDGGWQAGLLANLKRLLPNRDWDSAGEGECWENIQDAKREFVRQNKFATNYLQGG